MEVIYGELLVFVWNEFVSFECEGRERVWGGENVAIANNGCHCDKRERELRVYKEKVEREARGDSTNQSWKMRFM